MNATGTTSRVPAGRCLFLLAAVTAGCGGGDPPRGEGAGSVEEPIAIGEPSVTTIAARPAPRPTGPLAPGAGCITAECHAGYATARQVHFAIGDGECVLCHEPDQGDHTFPLTRPGNTTCTFCHAVAGNLFYQHAAVEVQGCTACHDPHASDSKFLLTSPSMEILCYGCHVKFLGANRHGPFAAGECSACHRAHESSFASLLRGGDGPDHCFMCHAETRLAIDNATYVHEPAGDGCTVCHDPHASDYEYALRQPIEKTCFTCHEDIEKQVAGSAAAHAAVFTADRCANCHDAHASARPALLRDRQDVLCLTCHGEPIVVSDDRTIPDMRPLLGDREFLHGPVKSGDCAACHNVHGASHDRLLREQFTDKFYAPFDLGNYALCFMCHESALVTEARTDALTDFRDGDLNLHYLHVNRERKGRTCRACHEIHASNLPRHMAETVPFEGSGWALPLGFRQTATGGSCAPGCHDPRTYSRLRKVVPDANEHEGGVP